MYYVVVFTCNFICSQKANFCYSSTIKKNLYLEIHQDIWILTCIPQIMLLLTHFQQENLQK